MELTDRETDSTSVSFSSLMVIDCVLKIKGGKEGKEKRGWHRGIVKCTEKLIDEERE